jgi:hypothetical protein
MMHAYCNKTSQDVLLPLDWEIALPILAWMEQSNAGVWRGAAAE